MRVDDYPYGGGAGMVMEAEPVYRAVESVTKKLEAKHSKNRISDSSGPGFESDDGGRIRPVGRDDFVVRTL